MTAVAFSPDDQFLATADMAGRNATLENRTRSIWFGRTIVIPNRLPASPGSARWKMDPQREHHSHGSARPRASDGTEEPNPETGVTHMVFPQWQLRWTNESVR